MSSKKLNDISGYGSLPVIKALVSSFGSSATLENASNTVVVCAQHLLFTTLNLLDAFTHLGVKQQNIHIIGKLYSNCDAVISEIVRSGYRYYPNSRQDIPGTFTEVFSSDVAKMWNTIEKSLEGSNIKAIFILDDGGFCISSIAPSILEKYQVVGIEQTSSGIRKIKEQMPSFPVIDVAKSGAKQFVESPMIADVVVQKVDQILSTHKLGNNSCGVIGLGVIGTEVVKKLGQYGHQVFTYDEDQKCSSSLSHVVRCDSLDQLLQRSTYIFGCSGCDITYNADFERINGYREFISCSSHDKEFLTMIKYLVQHCNYSCDSAGNIDATLRNGSRIKVLAKGYPINFDGSGKSVEAKNIQLTRGLLLGAFLQSFDVLSSNYSKQYDHLMLSPYLQKFIVNTWIPYGAPKFTSVPYMDKFKRLDLIMEASDGMCKESAKIKPLVDCI